VTGAEPQPDAMVSGLLSAQLDALQQPIMDANLPGNLDGLLAHHLLGGRRLGFGWNLDPMTPDWLDDNAHRLTQSAGMAVLGYGLTAFAGQHAHAGRERLVPGLAALRRRDPFPRDGVTFVNDPSQIVGLILAVNAVAAEDPQAPAWLREVLQDNRLRPPTTLLHLIQEHARQLLGIFGEVRIDPGTLDDPVELAALHWLTGTARRPGLRDPGELRQLRARLLHAIMLDPPRHVGAFRAALLINAATKIVTTSLDDHLLERSHVGLLLSRFPDVMRRWRYDTSGQHPIRWPITSEREVQDILWMILRPVFDDLVDEETLPTVGHSTYRADFAVPSLGVLIEVKYARKAADFKAFEKEIFEDYVAYLSGNGPYQQMIVFIYDESCSVQEHGTTRSALLAQPGITDVIIVSRPSQVPAKPRSSRPRQR
jgi:REase_DpnII-MboI